MGPSFETELEEAQNSKDYGALDYNQAFVALLDQKQTIYSEGRTEEVSFYEFKNSVTPKYIRRRAFRQPPPEGHDQFELLEFDEVVKVESQIGPKLITTFITPEHKAQLDKENREAESLEASN